MTINGVLTHGSALFNSGAAKFGSNGRAGGAFSVSGVDNEIISTKIGTIEAWCKLASPGGVIGVVFAGRNSEFWLGANPGDGHLVFYYNGLGGSTDPTTPVIIADGAWHHVAMVFSASRGDIYCDGSRIYSGIPLGTISAQTSPAEIGDIGIGASAGTAYYPWGAGAIDEVRFSRIARYNYGSYTVPSAAHLDADSNTIAVYHMEGNANDTATTGTGEPLETAPGSTIAPNDANILYSPYNWDVTSTRAISINAGAYFKTLIDGSATALTLKFNVAGLTGNLPQIWYRVDDGPWTKATLAATVPLTMPTSANSWTKHYVEVVIKAFSIIPNKWAGVAAAVNFTGITTVPSGCVTVPITKRSLRVITYGDSITEGLCTMKVSTYTPEVDGYDAMEGHAWRLAENLGAEVGVVGFGSQGLTVGGVGSVPAFPSAWNFIYSGVSRSFAAAPDLVVINQSTNDSGSVTSAMTTTLNAILTATPITTMIAVVRPFGGYHAAELIAAVAACSNPRRVKYIDTAGWMAVGDTADGLHPFGYTHANLSTKLAAALRGVLRRGSIYNNVGGTAKLVSPIRL